MRRHPSRRTALFSIVVAAAAAIAALGATTALAERPIDHQYGSPMAAERVTIKCSAEWDPLSGWTQIYLFASDTPMIPHPGISGDYPYASGIGTGVFTASGKMHVVCPDGRVAPPYPPETRWHGKDNDVYLWRGGADFTLLGTRLYTGKGRVDAHGGRVVITVEGTFIKICKLLCQP